MKRVDEERSVSAGRGKAFPRVAVCGVGDARRVRAVKLGAFGLKPTLARSPEKGTAPFWWKPAFGPVGRNPDLCGAGCGRSGIPPSGCMAHLQGVARKRAGKACWKGRLQLEKRAPIAANLPHLTAGRLRGMPPLSRGLHDPAFHCPYRRRACFSPYLPHLPRTGENLC